MREEIEKKIEQLNNEEFYIQMNDHMSSRDFDRVREIHNEIKKLEDELKELEGNK